MSLATVAVAVALVTPSRALAGVEERRIPESIDATGREDVGGDLTQFFASVPNGSTVVFPAQARYRVEQNIIIGGRQNLTILGNGATVFATTREPVDRSQWVIRNSSGVVFRNLSLVGAHESGGTSEGAYVEDLETQHGFRLEGASDIELDRVNVSNVFGDFVYIGRNDDHVPSKRIWIHDSTFSDNGRQGVAITDADGVVIERNHFSGTRRSVIDIEPNTSSSNAKNVFVLDNVVGPGRLLFVASHGGGPVDDVVISRNELRGHALTIDVLSPEGQRRTNWVVAGNTSDTPLHQRGLRFIGIDGVLVRGNRQEVTGGEPALIFWDTCGAVAEENDFGSGTVEYKGEACDAELRFPVPPMIIGRNEPTASTTTPTTSAVRPTSTVAPSSVATSSTRPSIGPGAETSVSGAPPAGASGGAGGAIWPVAVAFAVVAVAAILWWRRARRAELGR